MSTCPQHAEVEPMAEDGWDVTKGAKASLEAMIEAMKEVIRPPGALPDGADLLNVASQEAACILKKGLNLRLTATK